MESFVSSKSSSRPEPLRLSEDGIRLGARLRAALADDGKVLLLTGVAGQDGVTAVATQIGLALAQTNEGDVVLVDGNWRRPCLHEIFDVARAPGLSELIMGKATIENAIHVSELPSLSCLTAGTVVDPAPLLASPGYANLMRELRGLFRFIVLDAPPLRQFADATLMAPRADGVVMVAAAGRRRRSDVLDVKQALDGLRVNLLGVVLADRKKRLFGLGRGSN
jgi:capsular exopolysaccharide synthesis family protein